MTPPPIFRNFIFLVDSFEKIPRSHPPFLRLRDNSGNPFVIHSCLLVLLFSKEVRAKYASTLERQLIVSTPGRIVFKSISSFCFYKTDNYNRISTLLIMNRRGWIVTLQLDLKKLEFHFDSFSLRRCLSIFEYSDWYKKNKLLFPMDVHYTRNYSRKLLIGSLEYVLA